MKRVLFVCTGNICRSPTAEGVFRHFADAAGVAVEADSAGTHGYHIGDAPDSRTVDAAAKRGFDLKSLRARRVKREDFDEFDLILAMDRDHLAHLQAMRPKDARAEVKLFLDYHPAGKRDVPDPYYGGPDGFEHVLDLVEAASRELLKKIR
jgi:protein-tyrosine phosphatase